MVQIPTPQPVILIVDDEERVRSMLTRAFRHHPYQILTAAHGQQGLELFLQHQDEIALVISDVLMPICGGPEMLRQIRQHRPGVPALLISAHFDTVTLESDSPIPILRKPFLFRELLDAVEQQLAQTQAPQPSTRTTH